MHDDHVHIDSKWFFTSEVELKMCLTEGEAPPQRHCKHKSHVEKVMFLSAVAHPRFDIFGNCTFDGKIGLWSVTQQVMAQRGSVNRPAGTIETKPLTLTKGVCLDFLVQHVLPAV